MNAVSVAVGRETATGGLVFDKMGIKYSNKGVVVNGIMETNVPNLGPHASELIQEGALAVSAGIRVHELTELIHPHPTLSEAIWEAALGIAKSPIHLAQWG